MAFALSWQNLVRMIGSIAVVIIFLYVVINGGATAKQIFERISAILMLLVVTLSLLAIPKVFHIFHKLTLAKYWMFPLLDGEWDAELYSNWPRIERMYKSAKKGGPKFDALSDELSKREEGRRHIRADVTIKSSLFSISLTLRPLNSERISRSRFVNPIWHKPNLPELSYVFEQEDLNPVANTDERNHFGAGIVHYDANTCVISGEYWNDRREDAGLNTAGTIKMKKKT